MILILPLLSLAFLAAHALRSGDWGLAAALAALAGLCALRQGWLRLVLAAILAGACLVWTGAGTELVRLRVAEGAPWLRLALILAGVLGCSALSAALLCTERGRAWFRAAGPRDAAQAAAFLLTALALCLARARTPLAVLLADRFWPGSGPLEILGLALYAAWLAGRLLAARDTSRPRLRAWTLFTAAFFGQLALGLLVSERFLMTGDLHLPVPALIVAGPLFRGQGLFMPVLFAATALVLGPAWCSWLCYIGAWDARLAAAAKVRPRDLAAGQERAARWSVLGRGINLALVCGAALGLRAAGASWVPALALAAAFGLVGVAIMLILSRRAGIMVHCVAWCPVGLLGNILGRINPLRLRLDPSCTRCGACAGRCRYGALTARDIARGRPGLSCTLCGDCLGACGQGSLGYRFPGLSSASARTLFLVLAASLHAVFLGVARI